MNKLELSQAEIDAVIDYVYAHVRTAAPNGKGFKVWQKMFEFGQEPEMPLFDAAVDE